MQVVQGDQSGKDPPLATPAADVWALGVIAYEVLCGTCMTTEIADLHKLAIFAEHSWSFVSFLKQSQTTCATTFSTL